eukprot:GHVQ01015698.1.p1 GENE.GHVQ01015698.1~~GHVQ01015698.1.p1  ORF type:complete len:494 (+),score=80.96 GHVQ01015698.1:659-2140(+)
MPPKKAVSKKGGKGGVGSKNSGATATAVEETIPDDVKDMMCTQLRQVIEERKETLKKAESDRRYMQAERNMVENLKRICEKDIEESDSRLLVKDVDQTDMFMNHKVEIKVYQQKIELLQYEHRMQLQQYATMSDQFALQQLHAHEEDLSQQMQEKNRLGSGCTEMQLSNEVDVRSIEEGCAQHYSKLREQFEKHYQGLEAEYQEQLQKLERDLKLREKVEIHEIEERKNQHINELMKNHQESFGRMKGYYNDITHDNLRLIRSLRDEIAAIRHNVKVSKKKMDELQAENKQLADPLSQQAKQRAELQGLLRFARKDQLALANLKERSTQMEESLKVAQHQKRASEEQLRKIAKESEELKRGITQGAGEIRRRAGFKNVLLEKKYDMLSKCLDTKSHHLQGVLRDSQPAAEVAGEVTQKLQKMLGDKSKLIRDMQYEVNRTEKTFNDTIKVYDECLQKMGIHVGDIKFHQISGQTTANPACLVALPLAAQSVRC